MKTLVARIAALSVTSLICSNAIAEDDFWFGVRAGTLGLGVEATWRPIPWFDVRAGMNRFDYDDSGSQAGVNYDGTLTLDTLFATANFRFPLSPFRLTVGGYNNGNEVQLVSQDIGATAIYDIGGDQYFQSDIGTLTGTATFEDVAPYLGAGFDFTLAGRLGLALDFGVLWQGEPIVTLIADGPLATDTDFIDSLELERQQLEDEVKNLKAYPVVSIGFNFNF